MSVSIQYHIKLQENFLETLRGQKASAESAGDAQAVADLVIKIEEAQGVLARLQAA